MAVDHHQSESYTHNHNRRGYYKVNKSFFLSHRNDKKLWITLETKSLIHKRLLMEIIIY